MGFRVSHLGFRLGFRVDSLNVLGLRTHKILGSAESVHGFCRKCCEPMRILTLQLLVVASCICYYAGLG